MIHGQNGHAFPVRRRPVESLEEQRRKRFTGGQGAAARLTASAGGRSELCSSQDFMSILDSRAAPLDALSRRPGQAPWRAF
jgi:hypothetical protein